MKNFFLLFVILNPIFGKLISQNIIVQPYIQNINENSARILFETDISINSYASYGIDPDNLNNTSSSSMQSGDGTTRIHTCILSDLNPDTKYYYKINLANGSTSPVFHFTTLKIREEEEEITLIAISDMQMMSSSPNIFSDIINEGIIQIVNQSEGGIDNLHGILLIGDLVQNGGNYSEWRNTFFIPSQNLSPYVPFYPAIGNHDSYNNGLSNYLKYFDLPVNGDPGFPEQWWYRDFSNVRVISLNSNSSPEQLTQQLTWLQTLTNSACTDDYIDFVVLQLHHPFKSEMWTPGELVFTGEVIELLQNFSTNCGKPSVHLFGHTHGYSRGQSKDHKHLWVNVATAGGSIDYWGQFPNHDYEEFSTSEDEYGFVMIKAIGGPDPSLALKRYSRGDDTDFKDNVLTDEIILNRLNYLPARPKAIFPTGQLPFNCVKLKASQFDDPSDLHQASHWQISTNQNFTQIVKDIWKQHKNLYNDTDTQSDDDLTDENISNLAPSTTYYWRVRYRDQYLNWSEWSDTIQFSTLPSSSTSNMLLNEGAENGTLNWTGQIESLTSNECESVPPYLGQRFFAVGGVCSNEQNLGTAEQRLNVSTYAGQIDNNELSITYSGYLRAYAYNNDSPEISVSFYNAGNQLIGSAPFFGNNSNQWMLVSNTVEIPSSTRLIRFILRGTRFSGTDNDSYFDELSAKLVTTAPCFSCYGQSEIDQDGDGFCSDLDCDDNDQYIYPGALEICDGKDNNCDGFFDNGNQVTWTGSGDGSSWEDDSNWSQNFVPLPCQHVVIDLQDSIFVHSNPLVKSIFVGTETFLQIIPEANLIIDSQLNPGFSSLEISGELENHGRLDIKNSSADGIKLSGTVENTGRIYIDNIILNSINALSSSEMNSSGLIKIKK